MARKSTEGFTQRSGSVAGTAFARALGYFALWVVLIGIHPLDLAVGVPTAALAAWASVRLLAPGVPGLRIIPALALVPRFLWQSVVAGLDVARRALAPGVPLQPGFIAYPVGLPRGPLRNWFAAITSLMPGTVPVADEPEAIEYHCLDVSQPVAAQLEAEQQAWSSALGGARMDAERRSRR
jgi:multicomponent Na+:H+ antiporter subunit E